MVAASRYLAEGIGTFALVFFGTGAIIVNEMQEGILGHLGISAAFGVVVMLMIFAFGTTSGAHFNPAVTIAFANTTIFPRREVLYYLLAQLLGALLASLSLWLLFSGVASLGTTTPQGTEIQSFVLEVILTYFLMLVIIFVSQNEHTKSYTAFAVGAAVFLGAFVGGPISGASMNPARSLAPALVSGEWASIWIYCSAPVLGATLASLTWRLHQAAAQPFKNRIKPDAVIT